MPSNAFPSSIAIFSTYQPTFLYVRRLCFVSSRRISVGLEFADSSVLSLEFAEKAIQQNTRVLECIGSLVDKKIHEMIWNEDTLRAYKRSTYRGLEHLKDCVPACRWSCCGFAVAWIRSGGSINQSMSIDVLDYDEVYLEYARIYPPRPP